MYWREYFPRSRPRAAKGGIKAQSKRGSFGTSWWAKRWIAVLESFHIGARLGRGRSYARRGQVLSIDIGKGSVKAKVQGSFARPYDITIEVKPLSKAEWKKLAETLASQALYAAKLLAGEIPQDIETVFTKAKLSLFPEKLKDLTTDCSCPDWSNPCKHIAAVYYLLGEEFDRDPFLLFKLRGLDRAELLKQLGESAGAGVEAKARTKADEIESAVAPPEPLAAQLPQFWQSTSLPENFFAEVSAPPVSAALPRRLGNFPFWRGTERFLDALAAIYGAAAQRGQAVFLGESVRHHER